MKAVTLTILALFWAGFAHAGEIIKRPLGLDAEGQVIEGYVFQGGSSCNRRSSSRSYGSGYGYAVPYSYGYGSSIYVPARRSNCQAPVVVQPRRSVVVVPQRAPVVKPVPVTPVRAQIIIR